MQRESIFLDRRFLDVAYLKAGRAGDDSKGCVPRERVVENGIGPACGQASGKLHFSCTQSEARGIILSPYYDRTEYKPLKEIDWNQSV